MLRLIIKQREREKEREHTRTQRYGNTYPSPHIHTHTHHIVVIWGSQKLEFLKVRHSSNIPLNSGLWTLEKYP